MITDRIHKWLDEEGFVWSSIGNNITVNINSLDKLLEKTEKLTSDNSSLAGALLTTLKGELR